MTNVAQNLEIRNPDSSGDDAASKLAQLKSEFPVASRIMPLPHFTALACASDEVIDLAVDLSINASFVEPTADDPIPPECGALAQWQREVASGFRKKTTMDALWLAATHEANARDELRAGLRDAARISRRKSLRAAETISDTVRLAA
jgi:hypothetical protein